MSIKYYINCYCNFCGLLIAKATIGFKCNKIANHPFQLKKHFFNFIILGISTGPVYINDYRQCLIKKQTL